MLPRSDLLAGSRHADQLTPVLDQVETALRTWEPCWTPFLEGAVREEAEERLGGLADLELQGDGGFPGAERQRLLLWRRDSGLDPASLESPLIGLELAGNFLFDPAEPDDLRSTLLQLGLPASGCGDLWLRGDRGGEAVLAAELAGTLDGREFRVRSVTVQLSLRPLANLQPPQRRQPRRFHTVEASTRLDAVASAGFGLARSRMASLIRAGQVRVNWEPVNSPSRELVAGERVQLSGRGELCIEAITPTKRDRFRVNLLRS
ncbi:MAG: photosystem II S4 domain protein [Cyanobium sp.]|nr:photosystem II S4 domain protein [Cyanobium sp.]